MGAIHEHLHSHSSINSYKEYIGNWKLEEACVETIAYDIAQRLGVTYNLAYAERVRALRQISELTDMTAQELAVELIGMKPQNRNQVLKTIVDKWTNRTNADKLEIDLLKDRLVMLGVII